MFKDILFAACASILCISPSFAQVKEVIISEGGSFGAPGNQVKFCAYNPTTKNYYCFDSIPGDFTHNAAVVNHTGFLYAGNANDTMHVLCKYDLLNKKRLTTAKISGIQDIVPFNNKLLITKGYPATGKYFAIYNQSDLSLVKEFTEINLSAQGIAISGDKAYIALEGSFPSYTDSGTFAIVNLATNTFEKMIRLDTLNKIIRKIQVYNNRVYCFGDSLITSYNLNDNTFFHFGFSQPFKVMDIQGRNVIIKYNNNDAYRWMIDSAGFALQLIYSNPSINGIYDYKGNNYFCNNSDYFSFGNMIQKNITSGKLDTVKTGISAESIALYYQKTYPVNDQFTISANKTIEFDVLANDFLMSGNTIILNAVSTSQLFGSQVQILNNKIKYTATNLFVGNDTLTYEICDNTDGFCLSAKAIITVNNPLGIESNTSKINIYPNPSSDYIHVDGISADYTIDMISLNGKQVYNANQNGRASIDCRDLPKGLYSLRITENNTIQNYKIILQ